MESERNWLDGYFERYVAAIHTADIKIKITQLKTFLIEIKKQNKKIIFAGNGGSAAIASHCSVDFTKQAKIRAINFNEADLITCYANDYGYEHWIAKALESYCDKGDIVVLISSSGNSNNIIQAAKQAKTAGNSVITFTGFDPENPLKQLGDLNFWVNSKAYNVVECVHQIWLLAACDLLIGRAEYSAVPEMDSLLEKERIYE